MDRCPGGSQVAMPCTMSSAESGRSQGRSGRAWAHRARAALLRAVLGAATAAVLLVAAEVALRVVMGPAEVVLVRPFWDPSQPAFEERGDGVHPVFQSLDAVGPFPSRPAAGTLRVVFFGGSSVRAGALSHPMEEFPARTAAILRSAGVRAECINLGRPGLDTATILPIAKASLAYAPDVAVIYAGHNDIGNLTMVSLSERVQQSWPYRLRDAALHSRLYFEVERAVMRGTDPLTRSAFQEVDRGAVTAAEEQFEDNLRQIATALQRGGAEVVLVLPVSNVRGLGPTASGCPAEVPASAARLVRGVRHLDPAGVDESEVLAALERRPECADLLWLRGHHLVEQGRGEEGAVFLRRAIDRDPVPIRATARMVEQARRVGEELDLNLVDLERDRPLGAPPEWFLDELHLSPEGHRAVAREVAEAIRVAVR